MAGSAHVGSVMDGRPDLRHSERELHRSPSTVGLHECSGAVAMFGAEMSSKYMFRLQASSALARKYELLQQRGKQRSSWCEKVAKVRLCSKLL
eukprot:864228-Amphidinium_carterae.1